jgi:peptidoglycan hydrolase CwlO-like protein
MDKKQKPKNQFEAEMTRMMETVILKLDGFETRFDNLEKDVSEIKSDVRVMKGQFSGVASMVIGDNKRITKLEGEVAELQNNIH